MKGSKVRSDVSGSLMYYIIVIGIVCQHNLYRDLSCEM